MTAYADENEQWEALKTWWKANGKVVVFSVVAALAISYGYRYWQNWKQDSTERAAMLYDQLLVATSDGQIAAIADSLEKNYKRTPYASLAALTEAKKAVDEDKMALAGQKLQWVIDNSNNHALREIARVREARVLLAQNQPEKALQMVDSVEDKAYLPAVNQVKGDIFLAQGKTDAAKAAYSTALAGAPAALPMHAYLKMEVEALPDKP